MSHLQNNLASNNDIYRSPIFLDSHNSLNMIIRMQYLLSLISYLYGSP